MQLINQFKEIYRKFWEKRNKPDIIKHNYNIPSNIKNSLKFRVVDCWDDEWTMAEIYALEWPAYPLENYWVWFWASPKHVDWLIIVWAISKNMKNAVLNAWERIPEPKIIVALWDKAINWDDRFKEIAGSVKQIFKKQQIINIPWSPPKAQEIFSLLVSLTK